MPLCECRNVCYCRDLEPPESVSQPLGFWGWVAMVMGLGIAGIALMDENVSLK
jgi:hypothetical protein